VKPNIFYDRVSLKDGEPWEVGFIDGLTNSIIMTPIVTFNQDSSGSIGNLCKLSHSMDWIDNVLLEWDLALTIKHIDFGIPGNGGLHY